MGGLMVATIVGNMLLFWAFGKATEMLNKRVRDQAFKSLVRQEVAWFDVRNPGDITSQLSDDAAKLQAFVGEPIRSAVVSLSSTFVGIVLSFSAEAEMKMYMGEDEGDISEGGKHLSGSILLETLGSIRTVVSLTLEKSRSIQYLRTLQEEDPTPIVSNFKKGSATGLGQFIQFWGMALMFWWGGWLLFKYPGVFDFRDFMISMFGLLFSLYGLSLAFEGMTDRKKARLAANRIFELTDRKSLIDPLSEDGRKDV